MILVSDEAQEYLAIAIMYQAALQNLEIVVNFVGISAEAMQQVVKGKESGVLIGKLQGWKAFPLRINFISNVARMNLKAQNDTVVDNNESDCMQDRELRNTGLKECQIVVYSS